MPPFSSLSRPTLDLARTLLLWGYFTLGFLTLFLPLYVGANLLAKDRQAAFQKLNHRFFHIFFRLVGCVIPRVAFNISPEVTAIRGAVIVSNHRSYLDPILLISLFERQKTIVKPLFFKVPMFSWVLRTSGYIPASSEGALAAHMLDQVEGLETFFANGGNLFVFPEGTRGMASPMAKLEKGAFRIAKLCNAPIEVIRLENTDGLFPAGKFLFNTCEPPVISVTRIGGIASGEAGAGILQQIEVVRGMYESRSGDD
jgi:1-acyl-sn-glycerol-3-phosphate acyltransferase